MEEQLEKQVRHRRQERVAKFGAAVYFFFEGKGNIEPIAPQSQRDCGSFVLALGGLPKDEIRDRYEGLIRKLLTAISLGISNAAGLDGAGEDAVFFKDGGKAIFGFSLRLRVAEVSVSRRTSDQELALTRQLASRVAVDANLERVVRLLNESLESDQDRLQRFLSAWMALEVLANRSFSAYEHRFWDGLSVALTPPLRERYLKRIREVMSDKCRLLDKLILISAELCPDDADADIALFERAKKLRDDFSHGDAIDEQALPLSETQALLRRLLRLHFMRS